MREPGSSCLACGGETRRLYSARRPARELRPDELRCTSPHLGEYNQIWSCSGCGLAYQVLDLDDETIADGYEQVEDPLYLTEEAQRRTEFQELLDRVEAHHAPGAMLEVGSFAGLALDEARNRGWTPVGLEPSRWAAEHARDSFGLEVIQGTLSEAPWPPESFDAVCMWDVLEHVPDPLDAMRRMLALTKPGGVVALTTVNIAGRSARLLRRRWPWLMQMHLWYFTPESLRLLFTKAGFSTVRLEPHRKRLRLGYILKRSERYGKALARGALRLAERTGLAERIIAVDLGDIVLAVGRKDTSGDHRLT